MEGTSSKCLVCGGPTYVVLDLGRQPLANLLLATPSDPYELHNLALAACSACSHGQLTHFVDPSTLFAHYLYASSTSGTLRGYFDWFAANLRQMLPQSARILEIACNDGALLKSLGAQGFDAIGIDPAVNLTECGRARGLNVVTGFFPASAPQGPFDAIIAMNVLAHTPKPAAIIEGIRGLLAPGGMAFVQTSQTFMLEHGQFDTIYHEHYSFFTPRSMRRLCTDHGLRLDAIVITTVHGGSALYLLRHADAPTLTQPVRIEPSFVSSDSHCLKDMSEYPIGDVPAHYERFAKAALESLRPMKDAVLRQKIRGLPTALTGVAAKSMTFIRAAAISPDAYLDEADLKIGRYVPGTGKAVGPLARAGELPDQALFMIGAWNFADEISTKVASLRPDRATRFITAFPEFKEWII